MLELQDQIRRALILSSTPMGRKLVQAEIAYNRDCLALYALIGPPLTIEQLKEITTEVACQSTHNNSDVPGHLTQLLRNKWVIEGSSNQYNTIEALLFNHPPDCGERCLAKFLELLEKAKERV